MISFIVFVYICLFLKISINELLLKYSENKIDLGSIETIVVYDMQSEHTNQLDPDHSLACILLRRLASKYHSVSFLTGGLVAFQQSFPHLCQHHLMSSSSSSSSLSSAQVVVPPVVVVQSNSSSSSSSSAKNNNDSMAIDEEADSGTNQTASLLSSSSLSVKSNETTWSPNMVMMKPKQARLFCHSLSTFGLNLNSSSSNQIMSSSGGEQASCGSNNLANNLSVLSSSTSSSTSPTVSSLASSSLSSFTNYSAAMYGTVAGSSEDDPQQQPTASKPNKGPTEILGFLYLGSQDDSLSEQTLKVFIINMYHLIRSDICLSLLDGLVNFL